MDNVIQELQQLTQQVVDEIDSITFEELVEFVERREQMVSRISTLIRDGHAQHKQDILNLLQYDTLIMDKMRQLKDEANIALLKAERARVQKTGYEAAYTPDSIFF